MPPVSDALKGAYADVGAWRRTEQLPIVYHSSYNIGFWGLERVHPFDSQKFRRIVQFLEAEGLVRSKQLVRPVEASTEVLRDVHTREYLDELHSSSRKVAAVAELAPLALLPNWLVQNRVCKPFRHHVSGTMLAAALALEHGWAINVGGGMHHARFDNGEGWCAYSDLTLAARRLRRASGGSISKCMIVDLDVHQGNGHERDKLHFEHHDLYILDIYGRDLWPGDTPAKQAIDIGVGIPSGTGDIEYLDRTKAALHQAFQDFKADIVLYNAGTDILVGDPLGHMQVSAEGVQQRDQLVWQAAAQAGVPICMVLSGGYARDNHRVVSSSLANLLRTFQLIGSDGTPQLLQPLPWSVSNL